MSFVRNDDAKEQVRQAIDIVDLVGSYLPLRRQGANFVGLCPWHDDTKPSLQVNQARQSWKCWVCDVGGDIFNFVMQREGIDFREALEMLADRAGVVLQQQAARPQAKPGSPDDKKTLYEASAWAEQQFRDCLERSPDAEAARRYFDQRDFTAESRAAFHLGFSPDSWQWLLDRARSTKYSTAVLEATGLLGRSESSNRHYDRFKGRVIFPIRDTQSRPIAFGGRILPEFATDRAAKYVNSPETRLFSKSDHVYALDLARDAVHKSESKNVVVVEGYTDVITAHQHGLKNVVAVLGTALGERHIRLLRRYADTITLVLDGDETGQRRTNEVLELFIASEVDLRILTLPEGLDPCDFVSQRGAKEFEERIAHAPDAFEHAVESRMHGLDPLRDTHRANQALEQLLVIISKAPRMSSGTSSARMLRERQTIARLARDFRVDESALRTRIGELRKATPARRPDRAAAGTPPVTPQDIDPCDVELIELLTQHPNLIDTAIAEIVPEELSSGATRVIYEKYRIVSEQGEPVEFTRILTELEDPRIKSLFVSLDEQASAKEKHAQEDAPARLRRLIDHIRVRREDAQGDAKLAALEREQLDEQEGLELLRQLEEQQRKRQGISAPTDG